MTLRGRAVDATWPIVLVAGALAFDGKSQIGRIKPPERTIRSTKQTIATLQRKGGGNGTAGASPS